MRSVRPDSFCSKTGSGFLRAHAGLPASGGAPARGATSPSAGARAELAGVSLAFPPLPLKLAGQRGGMGPLWLPRRQCGQRQQSGAVVRVLTSPRESGADAGGSGPAAPCLRRWPWRPPCGAGARLRRGRLRVRAEVSVTPNETGRCGPLADVPGLASVPAGNSRPERPAPAGSSGLRVPLGAAAPKPAVRPAWFSFCSPGPLPQSVLA